MNKTPVSNVLIVDDEPQILDFLETALRLEGLFLQVSKAADRDAALQAALAQKPQLILMDYTMPGMEASEFVSRVRKDLPGSIIVLMTSEHLIEEKAGGLGLSHFLCKPFDLAMLREKVRVCMSSSAVA